MKICHHPSWGLVHHWMLQPAANQRRSPSNGDKNLSTDGPIYVLIGEVKSLIWIIIASVGATRSVTQCRIDQSALSTNRQRCDNVGVMFVPNGNSLFLITTLFLTRLKCDSAPSDNRHLTKFTISSSNYLRGIMFTRSRAEEEKKEIRLQHAGLKKVYHMLFTLCSQ